MGAGLCAEIEEEKEEESRAEERRAHNTVLIQTVSQLTEFPKRWEESGGKGERNAFTSWTLSAAPV